MLPEQMSQLLTAYIDGELSSRKKRAVQRLLKKSSEAQTMLRRLEEDARLLRSLPQPRLERDVSADVMRSISERRLQLARRGALAQRPPFPTWAGFVAAASVLFAVFCSSYLYFYAAKHSAPRTYSDTVANNKSETAPQNPVTAPNTVVAQGPELIPAPKEIAPESPIEPKKEPTAIAEKAPETPKERAKPDDPKPEDIITTPTPNKKFEVFKEVNVRDTLSLALWELDKDKGRKQLRDELEKDSAHRMELLFKGGPKAIERIEAAFKAQGVRLLVERWAQERLKRQMPTNYVLFVEDVTPGEMAKILETIGVEDKKAETQRKGSGQFGQMFLLPMTNDDHEELRKLLGADPVKFGPRPKGPLGVDIRKPISDTTADQVSDSLKGKGTPRPEAGKPAVALTRQAIVLSYNPVRAPKTSAEIQKFMEGRPAKRPGTLQILLVLRANNG